MSISRIRTSLCLLLFLAAVTCFDSSPFSQEEDQGHENFMLYCAQCHSADAKGKGPHGRNLKSKPANLTLLAKKNGGIFDADAVYQLIDGRRPGDRAHLNADMPIWGCRHVSPPHFTRRIAKHYRPPPTLPFRKTEKTDSEVRFESWLDLPCDSEETIRARILSITSYLSRIQAP